MGLTSTRKFTFLTMMAKRIHISPVEVDRDWSLHAFRTTLARKFIYMIWGLLGLVIIGAYSAGLYACFVLARKTFSEGWDQIADVEAAKTFFPALIAVIGGPLLIWRVITSQMQATAARHQVQIAWQTHYTDLFTRAVEQLGTLRAAKDQITNRDGETAALEPSPNLEVRLGAIFTLERIARQSGKDYWPVVEVLCAYIRSSENTGAFIPLSEDEDVHDWLDKVPPPRPDIQAALSVLCRCSTEWRSRVTDRERRFDLSGAILQRVSFEDTICRGINLTDAHLENARFSNARLTDMEFDGAELQHSRFYKARIQSSSFQHANLYGAQFTDSHLREVFLWDTKFLWADFDGAKFENVTAIDVDFRWANLFDADLLGVEDSDADLLKGSLGDESTSVPLGSNRPATWPKRTLNDEERLRWKREPKKPPK